jgi:hypothetical protein
LSKSRRSVSLLSMLLVRRVCEASWPRREVGDFVRETGLTEELSLAIDTQDLAVCVGGSYRHPCSVHTLQVYLLERLNRGMLCLLGGSSCNVHEHTILQDA